MARFLLVHGSCHGAWCWEDVIAALAARGHEATAIDLPGHGNDPTPPSEATLRACGEAVLAALREPAIVVGHSWGGYPITQAAEIDPSQIAQLVYLCAYVPRSGHSLATMRELADRQPLLPAIRRTGDELSFTIDPAMAPDLFYHDVPDAAAARAVSRLRPQPIAPQRTPLDLTERSQDLPRSYVLCSEDRTIPPEFQAEMAQGFDEAAIHRMKSSHSPFLSDPEGLADILDRIAAHQPAGTQAAL